MKKHLQLKQTVAVVTNMPSTYINANKTPLVNRQPSTLNYVKSSFNNINSFKLPATKEEATAGWMALKLPLLCMAVHNNSIILKNLAFFVHLIPNLI